MRIDVGVPHERHEVGAEEDVGVLVVDAGAAPPSVASVSAGPPCGSLPE